MGCHIQLFEHSCIIDENKILAESQTQPWREWGKHIKGLSKQEVELSTDVLHIASAELLVLVDGSQETPLGISPTGWRRVWMGPTDHQFSGNRRSTIDTKEEQSLKE